VDAIGGGVDLSNRRSSHSRGELFASPVGNGRYEHRVRLVGQRGQRRGIVHETGTRSHAHSQTLVPPSPANGTLNSARRSEAET
jgi:hypothetical protein